MVLLYEDYLFISVGILLYNYRTYLTNQFKCVIINYVKFVHYFQPKIFANVQSVLRPFV